MALVIWLFLTMRPPWCQTVGLFWVLWHWSHSKKVAKIRSCQTSCYGFLLAAHVYVKKGDNKLHTRFKGENQTAVEKQGARVRDKLRYNDTRSWSQPCIQIGKNQRVARHLIGLGIKVYSRNKLELKYGLHPPPPSKDQEGGEQLVMTEGYIHFHQGERASDYPWSCILTVRDWSPASC